MTRKERIITALNRGIPDSVPTFELEFQLEEEMFGKKFITDDLKGANLVNLSPLELEKKLHESAEYFFKVYDALEYSLIPAYGPNSNGLLPSENGVDPIYKLWLKHMKEVFGDTVMFAAHGDGTYAIPDGNHMYDFAYRVADDPDGLKADALAMANRAIEWNKRQAEIGIETLLLCSDYCYNTGPFISPPMFAEFVQPYLAMIIKSARENGQYTIKHTDGNIMPILDQLVDANPHALHSIDPMAGVDIREVKKLVGDKVALCGNVHCAALQTGTEQEVIDSAEYCLKYGKENGGYVFCTSNIPFKGLDPARYELCLSVWRKHRAY